MYSYQTYVGVSNTNKSIQCSFWYIHFGHPVFGHFRTRSYIILDIFHFSALLHNEAKTLCSMQIHLNEKEKKNLIQITKFIHNIP